MKVLSSSDAFRNKYVDHVASLSAKFKAGGKGLAAAGGLTGFGATTAGVAAANASIWSTLAGWPLIGGFAAGKATAVGVAMAVSTGAVVAVPALLVGGGIAYAAYKKRQKPSLQQGTGIEELARAFARVVCLPMLACAVAFCNSNPAHQEGVLNYLQRKLGGWGYSESFVRDGFDEAMRSSPNDIIQHYEWEMKQLEAGHTEGIGATPGELPPKVVREFAEKFKKDFEQCCAA